MAGDLNHLEKMGRELKCPICLSLLNSAVSLNCNHVFCDSCIAKSMKSDSHCPVCKIPCRRREVRPASHMDNLVSIYKSMETSSGMNIFITQNVSSTKLSDENLQGEGSAHIRPSFPNKKRVQVPQTQSQGGVSEAAVRLSENSSRARKSNTDEGGEPALSPFFWLRDEENEEDLSQLSGKSPFHDGPFPDIPTFSDMKESDDETSNRDEVGKFPKLPDMFDSEMFEWTQRACSPELCSSPFKTQAVDTNIIKGKDLKKASNGRKRGKRVLAKNVKLMTTRHDDQRNIDTCGTGNPNEFSCKKSTKRGQKASKTVGTKCYVYDTDPELQIIRDSLSGKDTDPELDIIRDSDKRTPEMYKGRKRNSKVQFSDVGTKRRHENVCIDEFGKSLVAAAPPGKKKRFKNENTFVKSGNKGKKIHANNQSEHHVGSEEELESDVNNFGEASTKQTLANNDTIAQLSDLLVPLACKHKASESKNSSGYLTRQSKSGDGPSSKRISKMSSKCSSKEGISDEIRASHVNNLCTAEIPTTGNIQNNVYTKTSADPLTVKKFPCQTNDGVLQRCGNNLGKIQCAFCLSSQESEASGEMVHYYNGRPVAADYKGGSKVIHSHRNCTEWAPNVYFEDDVAINLEAELVRSRKIKCSCCGVKGAALGCYDKSCRKSFHVTCSKLMPQCRWDMDNFVMLCPLHPADNFPSERLQSQARASKCNMIKQPDPQPSKNAVKHDLNTSACWSASGSSKRCVLCCSALTDSEREIVSEFERISGISVSKKWKSSVTHVIASIDENGACKRTLKVMMGILDGKWILSIKWIQACIDAMKLVDEESFEITCDAHGVSNGPQLGRLRIQNKLPRLFDGFKFYFMGEFVTSYKGYLRDLITAAGGTILQRRPVSEYQDDLLSDSLTCQTFIIYSLEPPDQSRTSVNTDAIFNLRRRDAEAVARSSEAKVVTNSWVLNSIAACKVQSLGE